MGQFWISYLIKHAICEWIFTAGITDSYFLDWNTELHIMNALPPTQIFAICLESQISSLTKGSSRIFYILIENQQVDSTAQALKSIIVIIYKVLEVSAFTALHSRCMEEDDPRVWPKLFHFARFPHDSEVFFS